MDSKQKTFGSLTIKDKVYIPYIDNIKEESIESISCERDGTITVGYNYRNTINVNASRTEHFGLYVNLDEAISKQEQLRLEKLVVLNNASIQAAKACGDFIDKFYPIK